MSDISLSEALILNEEERLFIETAEETALTTNIYAEIRARLARSGIPPAEVAFIHDARTPAERSALFEAMNSGKIRVLIGSTEKMGTGMNAQERLLAVHQITPPWRPGDIEQQVGRMVRQGNRYPQVFQFVYVTEGSFDAYIWQLLENKAGFIAQIGRGQSAGREVEDIAENVLTFSEIKALASGNPKILQKVVLDSDLARLEAIRAAWRSARLQATWESDFQRARIADLEEQIPLFEEAIRTRDACTPKKFLIHLKQDLRLPGEQAFSNREAAGGHLRSLTEAVLRRASSEPHAIGRYKGLILWANAVPTLAGFDAQAFLRVGKRSYPIQGESDPGLILSLDARLRCLDSELANIHDQLQVSQAKLKSLQDELGRPWDHEERYQALQAQVDELARELDAGALALAPKADTPADSADTNAEVLAALEAIQAMHQNPLLLARFSEQQPGLAISLEGLKQLEEEIQEKQALLAFGQAILAAGQALSIPQGETVQFDLFGGFTCIPTAPNRRRGRR